MRRNAVILASMFLSLPLTLGPSLRGGEKSGFAFPEDKAGRLLDKLLRPGEPTRSATGITQPAALASSGIDNPQIPLETVRADVPKSKPEPGRPTQPRPLAEPLPFAGQRQDPVRPELVALPRGTRIRLQSIDVSKPIPLPTLGQAQPDRAPLTDPTFDASVAAALGGHMPARTTPAPFVRINVPDPFEHSHAVRLRTPPPESSSPPNAVLRTPGR